MEKYRREYQTDLIIPVWNEVDLAYKCIASVQATTSPNDYQITVVDNGSDAQPFEYWITKKFKGLNLLHLPFNHGYCRAANAGLALSLLTNSEYVLLLNSDCEIPQGDYTWLERLCAPLQMDSEIGAVGAVSDHVYGHQRRQGAKGSAVHRIVPSLIGFCLLLRKKAVEQVGLLDEQFEPGNFDDYDYSLRLWKAGWKLAVEDSVYVHHKMHASFKHLNQTENYDALLKRNKEKLRAKWGADALKGVGL